MQIANGSEWSYLHSGPDGTFFNKTKIGIDTFPGNVLLVTARTFKRGECWDKIADIPYNANTPVDLNSQSANLVGWQTNMKYTQPGVITVNGVKKIPLLYDASVATKYNIPPAYQGLWIADGDVQAFPSTPMDIVTTVNLYIREGGYLSSSLEIAMQGTHLTLTGYYVLQNRTYGEVTDPATNVSGFSTLDLDGVDYTTWSMASPVP